MRKLYTTKQFENLFAICNEDNLYVYGFDILDDNRLVRKNRKDIIEINPDCKLISKLIRDDASKMNLSELICNTTDEQAVYLGVSDRTLFRMKKMLEENNKITK